MKSVTDSVRCESNKDNIYTYYTSLRSPGNLASGILSKVFLNEKCYKEAGPNTIQITEDRDSANSVLQLFHISFLDQNACPVTSECNGRIASSVVCLFNKHVCQGPLGQYDTHKINSHIVKSFQNTLLGLLSNVKCLT